ncbi:MAG: hypothetical protein AB7H43_11975, partial [Acidimicrobiia bacterium]
MTDTRPDPAPGAGRAARTTGSRPGGLAQRIATSRWGSALLASVLVAAAVVAFASIGPEGDRAALGVRIGSVEMLEQFGEATGTTPTVAAASIDPESTWFQFDSGWPMQPWVDWLRDDGARRLVLSVPMMVSASAGGWDDVALDGHHRRLARTIQRTGIADQVVIRLGWQPNTPSTPWSGDPEGYRRTWRRLVPAYRAIDAGLRFDWSPHAGLWPDPERWYPGDDVVDIVGLTQFDVTARGPGGDPDARWLQLLPNLEWQVAFARAHGKPTAIDDWSIWSDRDTDLGGGGDNPTYVRNMARWVDAHGYLYAVWTGLPDDGHGTTLQASPRSLAAYREAFGTGRRASRAPQPGGPPGGSTPAPPSVPQRLPPTESVPVRTPAPVPVPSPAPPSAVGRGTIAQVLDRMAILPGTSGPDGGAYLDAFRRDYSGRPRMVTVNAGPDEEISVALSVTVGAGLYRGKVDDLLVNVGLPRNRRVSDTEVHNLVRYLHQGGFPTAWVNPGWEWGMHFDGPVTRDQALAWGDLWIDLVDRIRAEQRRAYGVDTFRYAMVDLPLINTWVKDRDVMRALLDKLDSRASGYGLDLYDAAQVQHPKVGGVLTNTWVDPKAVFDADARPDLQWWGTETRRRGKKLLLPETGLWRAPWPDAPSNAVRLGRGGNDNPAWYPLLVDELRNWVDVLALWSIFEHDPDTH